MKCMKLMLLFPFVLLLGLVIGGWAPKEELRTAKKEMKELQKRAERGDRENRVNAFTLMAKVCGLPTATLPSPLTTSHPLAPRG